MAKQKETEPTGTDPLSAGQPFTHQSCLRGARKPRVNPRGLQEQTRSGEMRNNNQIELLDKFKGWRCDSCGHVITRLQGGWVEWLASENNRGKDVLSGLRLVHRGSPKRNGREHNCRYDPIKEFRNKKTIVEGLPLERLDGPDGLMLLLSLLAAGELPRAEILELAKRVQIPGYEVTRILFQAGNGSKVMRAVLGHRCYLQSEMQEMLARAIQE